MNPTHKTVSISTIENSDNATKRVGIKRKKNKKNLYKFPLDLIAKLINAESQIPDLVEIERKCFPTLMQDQLQNFKEFLQDEFASGLILYKDDIPIGYIMGSHIHDENSAKAIGTNEFIKNNQDQIFYISSLSIIKEHRSVIALEFLIHEMSALLKSIGYSYFVAYVRKRHGLSRLLTRRLSAEILHTDENWEETGEPFDYCLVNLASIPSLPVYADYIFHGLRIIRRRLKGIR
jgi:hypothetical protein